MIFEMQCLGSTELTFASVFRTQQEFSIKNSRKIFFFIASTHSNNKLGVIYDMKRTTGKYERGELESTMGGFRYWTFHFESIGKCSLVSLTNVGPTFLDLSKGARLLTRHLTGKDCTVFFSLSIAPLCTESISIFEFSPACRAVVFSSRQAWLLCKCYFRQPCKRRQPAHFAFQRKTFSLAPNSGHSNVRCLVWNWISNIAMWKGVICKMTMTMQWIG